jgi:hypothetical protein
MRGSARWSYGRWRRSASDQKLRIQGFEALAELDESAGE